MADPEVVSIRLTHDEVLVLFDLLHRWEEDEQVTAPGHLAEQVVLWNLTAALEKVMIEPFDAAYERLVSDARSRLTPTD